VQAEADAEDPNAIHDSFVVADGLQGRGFGAWRVWGFSGPDWIMSGKAPSVSLTTERAEACMIAVASIKILLAHHSFKNNYISIAGLGRPFWGVRRLLDRIHALAKLGEPDTLRHALPEWRPKYEFQN